MNEIVAIVEGQTEYAFVERQLQPHFLQWNVHLWPTLPGHIHKSGGVRRWPAIKGDILRYLKERRDRICTTMFDFFAMPADWPGRGDAASRPWRERSAIVEQAMHQDIIESASRDLDPSRFIPYVQLHEFEALLFCDVNILATTVCAQEPARANTLARQLQDNVEAFSSPEEIDDGAETAPSKRIAKLAPAYHKMIHAPIIVDAIGLRKLRESCTNFNRWIERLETAVR